MKQIDDQGSDNYPSNGTTTLIYNAKLAEDSLFEFCFYAAGNDVGVVVPAGWLQYGYQVYGSHVFDQ